MVFVLLIIKLVEIASGALVSLTATIVEDVVGVATALWLLSNKACGRSFLYHSFGNLCTFICLRIGLTIFVVDLISVFYGQVAALRVRDSGFCKTSV